MAGKAVVDAVSARLAANWTTTPIVDADTTDGGPGDGTAYVTIEYPVATENQITIGSPGNNVFRETGVFRIVLNAPSGQAIGQAVDWIDQIRAIFRSKQFGNVTTFAPSPGIVNNSNYQGGRFVMSCAVPYQFDLFA